MTAFLAAAHDLAAAAVLAAPDQPQAPNTDGFAVWLRGLFGPLFLVIVGIVAIFFLFTREITRFVQFIVLALAIGLVFYVPEIIPTVARAAARALGLQDD